MPLAVVHVPRFKLLVSPVEPAFATQLGAAKALYLKQSPPPSLPQLLGQREEPQPINQYCINTAAWPRTL